MKITNKAKCFLHLGFDETDSTYTSGDGWLLNRTRPFSRSKCTKISTIANDQLFDCTTFVSKVPLVYGKAFTLLKLLISRIWHRCSGYLASTQRKPRIEHITSPFVEIVYTWMYDYCIYMFSFLNPFLQSIKCIKSNWRYETNIKCLNKASNILDIM